MVEAFGVFAFIVLVAAFVVTVMQLLPEKLQDKFWNKVGLGIDHLPPYDKD